jgi:RNA polymerase sigma factor (sigma-70 family)
MTTAQAGIVLRHIREMVAADHTSKLSDQLLLERFTNDREEEAFGELVRRYGPLVLGVCRRVLGNLHDAEDAFQATFLVLAQKGRTIGSESVGGWLYQVAYHVALRVRRRTVSRQQHEQKAAPRAPADPLAEVTGRELLSVLDEELQQLPDRYRTPLLFCHLQGMTHDETARQLGWSLRTLRRRLEQGRERLRLRLARRGLTLSAALFAASVGPNATAGALPFSLLASTVGLALQMIQSARAVPQSVAALADDVIKALLAPKLKVVAAAGLLLAGVIALGVGMFTGPANAGRQPEVSALCAGLPDVKEQPKNDQGKPADKKDLIVTGRVLDPDGKAMAKADVALVARPKPPLRGEWGTTSHKVLTQGKTDGEGRFRLSVPKGSPDTFEEVFVLARSTGYALGGEPINREADKAEVQVRLNLEQAVRGRLINLQGQPAVGVKVHVVALKARVSPKHQLNANFREPLKDVTVWPRPVTTDAKGRFILQGLRPDWNITLAIRDEGLARQELQLKAQDKDKAEEVALVLSPVRVLEGTVTYEDTGKPVPNARLTVVASHMEQIRFEESHWQTDAKGRFRALPHEADYFMMAAYPPAGEPYLRNWKEVKWPKAGVTKLEVHFKLIRGIVVRGTVTEADSGKPVTGAHIRYVARFDNNPFYRFDVHGRGIGERPRLVSGADGTFETVVLPGPAHLLINGPTADYVHVEAISSKVKGVSVRPVRRLYTDALVELNYKPGTEPQKVAVKLRRGVTVSGKVLTPDGKPVTKAQMICPAYLPYGHDLNPVFPLPVDQGRFELPGCDPDRAVPVYFLDAENQLGATAMLSGKDIGPKAPTVKLQPCGSATARFVDAKGQPLANLQPRLSLILNDGIDFAESLAKAEAVADEMSMFSLDKRHWKLRTDAQGRITWPTLIPGGCFTFTVMTPDGQRVSVRKTFTAEAGKTLDLKDITVKALQ